MSAPVPGEFRPPAEYASVLPGHALYGEGSAYYSSGNRVVYNSVGGAGRGMCECGEMSDELPSGAARKRWHRQHKATLSSSSEQGTQ